MFSLAIQVYCDMENDGGGWTVFQRRVDGSVDFYRDWKNYTHGFGSLEGEHWLGLSKLHRLANVSVPNEVQVDMGDFARQHSICQILIVLYRGILC